MIISRIVFGIMFLLNLLLITAGSSGAVPFGMPCFSLISGFIFTCQPSQVLCCSSHFYGSASLHHYPLSAHTLDPNMEYVTLTMTWSWLQLNNVRLGTPKSREGKPHSSADSSCPMVPKALGNPHAQNSKIRIIADLHSQSRPPLSLPAFYHSVCPPLTINPLPFDHEIEFRSFQVPHSLNCTLSCPVCSLQELTTRSDFSH